MALVHLIVPGQGYVGGFEVLARLVFHPVVGCNPVEELGAVFHVLCIGRLLLFQGFVVPDLLLQCGLAAIARQILCEIVAISESSRIENGAKSNNGDRGHGCVWGVWCICMIYKLEGWASVRSHVDWEDFLVLQVFLQRDAARHDGCELEVVHQAGTRVGS